MAPEPAPTAPALSATTGQAAIWLAEQAAPLGPAYNTCTVLRVRGQHDAGALAAACRALVAATPGLRLRFGLDPATGTVVQWFADPGAPGLTGIETATPGPEKSSGDLIAEAVDQPFEVDEGPLVRFAIVPAGPPGQPDSATVPVHEVAVVGHHLVVDGACQLAMARRLGDCIVGECPAQPEAAYTALVDEVRRREQAALAGDAAYWRERLPRHYPQWPRAVAGTARAPVGRVAVDASTMAAAQRAATAAGGRVSHLLAAAIYQVLSNLELPTPVICLAASVRPGDGSGDGVIGGFVTQVPLVLPDDPPATLIGLVRAATGEWREALRRRYYPFPQLSTMARRVAGTPAVRLDRVMITYRRVPERERWQRHGTRFEVEPHRPYLSAKSEISFRLLHHRDHLDCQVEMATAAVGRVTAAALAERFRRTLEREVGE